MIRYPMSFNVLSEAEQGIQTSWKTAPVLPNEAVQMMTAAIPPEFEGPGGGFSPEDFYALALANCFIATFKVVAEKSKLTYTHIKATGKLTVDRDEKGVPWMKAFSLSLNLAGATDPERALRLLEKTSQSCMVLNSVKTEKTFEFKFEG